MLERFTEKAIAVLTQARAEARRLEFARVTAENLFVALLAEQAGPVHLLLAPYGLNIKTARLAAERLLGRGYLPLRLDAIVFADEIKLLLKRANEGAHLLGAETVGPEHLLLALLQLEHEGIASMLQSLGVDRPALQRHVEAALREALQELDAPPDEDLEVLLKHFAPRLLTPAAAQALESAREDTIRRGHNTIGSEQLLLGLVHFPRALAGKLLRRAGLDELGLSAAVGRMIGNGSGTVSELLVYTHVVARVLEESWSEARRLGALRVGTGHLLLALLKVDESTASVLFKGSLIETAIDPEEMRWDLERILNHFAPDPEPAIGEVEETLRQIEAADEVPDEADEIPEAAGH